MKIRTFVQILCLLATAAAAAVWQMYPPSSEWSAGTVATLGAVALTAELMGFLLPKGASGSIAFIPNMTAILLVPNFAALLAIVGVRVIAELARRTGAIKFLFNTAQLLFSYAIGIILYRALGGVSLFELVHLSVADVTGAIGIPMLIAYIFTFAMNGFLVSYVIALSTNTPVWQVWHENNAATIGIDVLASPLVFAFADVYANFGPMIASLIWVPILGIRQLNTNNLELAQTNRELLELMVKSIEARDPYTSGHSRRVRDYALKIARLLALGPKEVEKIGTAALLHDVGKIYDKYAPILAKEDRLTADEWATIKEHPADGADLIATMTQLRELVPAVRHHHENWDGSGYPEGLREDQIPLASRIIMFADTLDAMTTERPYRGPLGEEAVRAEFIRCRGAQFDPAICDRLLANNFWASLFPPLNRSTFTPSMPRLKAIGHRR